MEESEKAFLENLAELFDDGNHAEVIDLALDFIENGSNNPEICNYFIMSARLVNNSNDYVELARKMVKDYEKSSELFAIHMQQSLGRLLYASGQYAEANSNFMLANCRYSPYGHEEYRAANLYYYATSLDALGNTDSALQVINRSVSLWEKVVANDPHDICNILGLKNARKIKEAIYSKS